MTDPRIFWLSLVFLAACATPGPSLQDSAYAQDEDSATDDGAPPPLPLQVPVQGLMAGLVDSAARDILGPAAKPEAMSTHEWLQAGLAAITLSGASTLITSHGSNPDDVSRLTDPDYQDGAVALQAASRAVGRAVLRTDAKAYHLAAEQLAAACQSCHQEYRPGLHSAASEFIAQDGGATEKTARPLVTEPSP
ncbi:MAG TPA: hypothetical protein VG942_06005 [Hyphomonadaceae bacterium]|nr:hypothetical protein [Hyphomonadaceae bacterium]